MKKIEKLCVFCGTKLGSSPAYEQSAHRLGEIMAQNDIELIYGAGGTGMMKAIAESVKKHGGHVLGVTIQHLYNIERPDLMEDRVDEVQVFQKMYARKVAMTSMSDAFCVLPGGLGTMDEIFELIVLKQLEILDKPIILVNVDGFYDAFLNLIQSLVNNGFVREEHTNHLIVTDNVENVIPLIMEQLEKKDC